MRWGFKARNLTALRAVGGSWLQVPGTGTWLSALIPEYQWLLGWAFRIRQRRTYKPIRHGSRFSKSSASIYLARYEDTQAPVRWMQGGGRPCCHTCQAGSADMQDAKVAGSWRLPPISEAILGGQEVCRKVQVHLGRRREGSVWKCGSKVTCQEGGTSRQLQAQQNQKRGAV